MRQFGVKVGCGVAKYLNAEVVATTDLLWLHYPYPYLTDINEDGDLDISLIFGFFLTDSV